MGRLATHRAHRAPIALIQSAAACAVMRMITSPRRMAAATALCALAVAAAPAVADAHTMGGGTMPAMVASGKTARVTIKDFEYVPMKLTVKAGTKVTFLNRDHSNHTVTFTTSKIHSPGNLNQGRAAP
jgi:plastocyanin